MASYNKVILLGNLTRDPELRYTPGGTAVATFGLAVNSRIKQGDDWKEEPCFVDIVTFGRQAENCSEYLSKGSAVLVDGRLKYSKWENQEGQTRTKLEVVANNVQFMPKTRGGSGSGGGDKVGGGDKAGGGPPPPGDEDVPF
jgi:single-strand DNA-binding protein